MHKIIVSFEEGKNKIIKINDQLFEIGMRKGLIEKTDHGFIFIGDYEELLAFQNIVKEKSVEYLD